MIIQQLYQVLFLIPIALAPCYRETPRQLSHQVRSVHLITAISTPTASRERGLPKPQP
jgi:hypothetical protein